MSCILCARNHALHKAWSHIKEVEKPHRRALQLRACSALSQLIKMSVVPAQIKPTSTPPLAMHMVHSRAQMKHKLVQTVQVAAIACCRYWLQILVFATVLPAHSAPARIRISQPRHANAPPVHPLSARYTRPHRAWSLRKQQSSLHPIHHYIASECPVVNKGLPPILKD